MDNSWFPKASFIRLGTQHSASNVLPRWRSPSPTPGSFAIPPPIVQSTFLQPSARTDSPTAVPTSTPLQDRQEALEADLQFLLDAQADGLVQGSNHGASDGHSTPGSATPTIRSDRDPLSRPVRPLRTRKFGLRKARQGIHNTIISLSLVKDEELQIIDQELQSHKTDLARVSDWEHKRRGLQEAAKSVDDTEELIRMQRLRKEANGLEKEIEIAELQLAEMKSRHSSLTKQVVSLENTVQAQLSSYSSSLHQLDADLRNFLAARRATSDDHHFGHEIRSGVIGTSESRRGRRDLEKLKAQMQQEQRTLGQRQHQVEREKTVLIEGAGVWKGVVSQVEGFEQKLRAEMMGTASQQVPMHNEWEDEPSSSTPSQRAGDNMRQLLRQLGEMIATIRSAHVAVQNKGWKLLVAAIGAELFALEQGKQVLESALGLAVENEETVPTDLMTEDVRQVGSPLASLHDDATPSKGMSRFEDDAAGSDDEPSPELMFSRREDEHHQA